MSSISNTTANLSSFNWKQVYPPGVEPAWEIAMLFPAQGSWSLEEYMQLSERSNQLVEFTAGRIEVLEMPTIEHQLIVAFLLQALQAASKNGELGMTLMAPHQTTILPDVIREPDIVFKLRENLPGPDEDYFTGADLVIEVVSSDKNSRKRDYETKVADYAEAKIPEYWIVDPQEQKITVLWLEGAKFTEHIVAVPGDQATSQLLNGFSVDVAAVFAAGKKR